MFESWRGVVGDISCGDNIFKGKGDPDDEG